jgi:transmembrane sensor
MNRPVDDIAADWAIRRDAGVLDAATEAELDAWIAEDPRRAGALLRAEAMLALATRATGLPAASGAISGAAREGESVERATALGDDDDYMASGVPRRGADRWLARPLGRRLLLGGGAGALAASAAGILLLGRAGGVEIETAIGEVRRVPLADGSTAALNTDSRLRVAIDDKARRIEIAQGEAFFEVAHDKERPFTVAAGRVRVRAVGTAFSVRLRGDGAEILVTQGVVETWVDGYEGSKRRIEAGGRSFVSDRPAPIEVAAAPQQIDRALAWRSGELALDGESLGYAVAELNRYNDRKVEVVGDALAAEPLVGYFRTNDPETFAEAAASLTGSRVETDGAVIRIRR